jgi:hypothetical protein
VADSVDVQVPVRAVAPGVGRLVESVSERRVPSVMAPETRACRDGQTVVPPLEVRVARDSERAVVPVAEHVVPRAANA